MKKIKLIDNNVSDCVSSSFLYNKIRNFFELNNYNLVENSQDSDFIIINTCGVTSSIEEKTLNLINNTIQEYGETKNIIIFGCLTGISEELKKSKKVELIPLKKEKKFEEIFEHTVGINEITGADINKNILGLDEWEHFSKDKKKRYFLHVARGCIHACSYCIIKKSIGFVASEPIDKIIEEFTKAIKNGYNEIVLVSDDLASYGRDINLSFDILFNKLCEVKGNYRIDLNYIEPSAFLPIFPKIKENFFRVSAATIPLQSGSNRILKLMKRKYTVESIITLLQDMRKYGSKDLKLLNHIILLYPTETEEDFKKSILTTKYYDNTLFIVYSYRNGLKKFNKDDQVDFEDRKKRLKLIRKLDITDNRISLANPF